MTNLEQEIHEAIQDKLDAYYCFFGCNDWDVTVYLSVDTHRRLAAMSYTYHSFGFYAEENNGKRTFCGCRVFIVNDCNHPDYAISIENKRLKKRQGDKE